MLPMKRTFAVEHRVLPGRRLSAAADDAAELRNVIDAMADVPRASTASIPDMLFYFRRLRGRLTGIADRLEIVEPKQAETRQRLHRPAPDPLAIAAAVFKPISREQTRIVRSRSGRTVRVVERSSRQMELSL